MLFYLKKNICLAAENSCIWPAIVCQPSLPAPGFLSLWSFPLDAWFNLPREEVDAKLSSSSSFLPTRDGKLITGYLVPNPIHGKGISRLRWVDQTFVALEWCAKRDFVVSSGNCSLSLTKQLMHL